MPSSRHHAAAAGLAGRLVQRLRRAIAIRRDERALRDLPDRLLADIGLDRGPRR